jgi:hypothetical protein
MDCQFYSTVTFRKSLEQLCRKERNGYHLCKSDICNLFKDLSFEDIWGKNYLIRDLNNIRVIKIRIPNSFQNLSSADGFRLIIVCNKKYKTVNFLNIYPKRGKLAQMDQTSFEYKRQLKEYGESVTSRELIEHDISNNLEIKIKPPNLIPNA